MIAAVTKSLVLCKLRVFHLRLRQKKLRLREKAPAPAENMWKLKFNRILTFQSGHTIFVSWYFMHAHFVQCMIDGIYSFTEVNKLRLRQNRSKLRLRPSGSGAQH